MFCKKAQRKPFAEVKMDLQDTVGQAVFENICPII
jgi:hypothetical protein